MLTEDTIIIRIDLSGKYKTMFEDIKSINKIVANTDVIRYCIEKAHSPSAFEPPSEVIDNILSLVKTPNIRTTYNVYNYESFLMQAINFFIQKLRIERGSLRSFTTRQHLTPEELQVAIELLDIIDTDKQASMYGVTLEQLAEKLQWPINKVTDIVKRFKEQDYVLEQTIHGQSYFYAPFPGE